MAKRKPTRKRLSMALVVSVPAWATAAQARKFVRELLNYPSNYEMDGPDFQEGPLKCLSARPVATAAPRPEPVNLRPLLRDVRALYKATGDEGSEEAEAVADLPSALNEALADVIRWGSPYFTPSEAGPLAMPRPYVAGLLAFRRGESLVQAIPYGKEAQHAAWCAGWQAGYLEAFREGVEAHAKSDEAENPHVQFSGAWDAWNDGFNARHLCA